MLLSPCCSSHITSTTAFCRRQTYHIRSYHIISPYRAYRPGPPTRTRKGPSECSVAGMLFGRPFGFGFECGRASSAPLQERPIPEYNAVRPPPAPCPRPAHPSPPNPPDLRRRAAALALAFDFDPRPASSSPPTSPPARHRSLQVAASKRVIG
jgi:hypothetical protein